VRVSACYRREEERMLQVTDRAATAFRSMLDRDDVPGTAIRVTLESSAEPGTREIAFLAVDGPKVGDVETKASGVKVVVAPELVDELDDVVLDAEESSEGPSFKMSKQAEG
jgi:Fe-S cluster assembly iron-binding protein IscA